MSDQAIVAALDDLYRVLDRQLEVMSQVFEVLDEPGAAENRRSLLAAHALGGLLASGVRGPEAVRSAVEYADLVATMLDGGGGG